MKNNRCGPHGGRGDPRRISGSRGDPPTICGVRGSPPWMFASRGDPPLINGRRGHPPEFFQSRGHPPEKNRTRDGPREKGLKYRTIGSQNRPHGRGMPEREGENDREIGRESAKVKQQQGFITGTVKQSRDCLRPPET